jgi:Protein of unknown function (DUF992)
MNSSIKRMLAGDADAPRGVRHPGPETPKGCGRPAMDDASVLLNSKSKFDFKLNRGTIMRNHMRSLLVVLAAICAVPASAQAPGPWTQVGMLTCKVNPSIGFIIAGHQSMECRFVPSTNSPTQAYEGALNMVGINIGISAGGILGWAVFAPTTGLPAGALAGEYVGASGDLGIGLGAGANVLIGGSARTVALQPVSLEGSVAVNVALGVSALKLRPVF